NISRSAAAQESQTVGNSASSPTLVEYFQQRSHLMPSAFSTVMRNSSPFAARSKTTWDTMNSDDNSDAYVSRTGGPPAIRTRASSDAPMNFASRASSSALSTLPRTSINWSQAASFSAESPPATSSGSGSNAMWTLSGAPAGLCV